MNTKASYVPAKHLTKLWRTLIEFNMLEEGDKILIGLSGGKDSMFLASALAEIKKYAPVNFEIACYTMNGQFETHPEATTAALANGRLAPGEALPRFPLAALQEFCAHLGVPHYTEEVDVLDLWRKKGGSTPCYTCAYFRRAATNRKAVELGFNKVAWAHHQDDAVETFMLNLFTTGQLKTFLPVTDLTRTGLKLIRPLLYYREQEVIEIVKELGLSPLKNPCPYDGYTQRQAMKEWLPELDKRFPDIFQHFAAAMRQGEGAELWPPTPPQQEMLARKRAFWGQRAAKKDTEEKKG